MSGTSSCERGWLSRVLGRGRSERGWTVVDGGVQCLCVCDAYWPLRTLYWPWLLRRSANDASWTRGQGRRADCQGEQGEQGELKGQGA